MTDLEIINLIKNGKHSKALAKLYKIYPAVQKYIIGYGGTANDAEDIFQDGLVIFIEKSTNLDFNLRSSISTFLFGICRNLCREKYRNSHRTNNQDQNIEEEESNVCVEEFLEEEKKYQALDKILIESGKKCMELLKMFYFDNLSMKAIAYNMGFKSETSAKTQKYKCLEKARDLTKELIMEQKQMVI